MGLLKSSCETDVLKLAAYQLNATTRLPSSKVMVWDWPCQDLHNYAAYAVMVTWERCIASKRFGYYDAFGNLLNLCSSVWNNDTIPQIYFELMCSSCQLRLRKLLSWHLLGWKKYARIIIDKFFKVPILFIFSWRKTFQTCQKHLG